MAKLTLTARMRRIRKTETKPEMAVRRIVHELGYRYRLYGAGLPGTPDLVFTARRKVIFVHGCFWHQHDCKLGRKKPVENKSYWHPKLARNVARDSETLKRLSDMGWQTLVIWECQTRGDPELRDRITCFLGPQMWSANADPR